MKLTSQIAGSRFLGPTVKNRIAQMPVGHSLLLEHDFQNKYDENAIKIIDPDTLLFLGFIQREVAKNLSPLLITHNYTCLFYPSSKVPTVIVHITTEKNGRVII